MGISLCRDLHPVTRYFYAKILLHLLKDSMVYLICKVIVIQKTLECISRSVRAIHSFLFQLHIQSESYNAKSDTIKI